MITHVIKEKNNLLLVFFSSMWCRSKKLTPYRSGQYGRYLSYWFVNRYRNTYVSFRFKFQPISDYTGLIGENQVFQPVKKKPEKHTTKKEKKKPRKCYRHRFQPCNPLSFFFYFCKVLKKWLVSSPKFSF